jgi:hypothetical protein
MTGFLNKPYDLLEYRKFEILHSYGIAFFNFIFLLLFKPFGLYTLSFAERLKSLSIYFAVVLPVILLNSLILKRYFFKKYTIGNTILWFTWSFILVAIGLFVVNAYLFDQGKFFIYLFFWFIVVTVIISIIPLSIIMLVHYNYVLIHRLKNAASINEILKNKHHKQHKDILLEDESSNKKLFMSLESLLYITSADNYVDICYVEENKIRHELIRNSLTNIEKCLANTKQLFRCHKSFIINLSNVVSITGNTAGYKLKINHVDLLIPVSRKLNNRILEFF